MSRELRPRRRSRAGIALVVAAFGAGGVFGISELLRPKEEVNEVHEAAAPDASTDARAPAARPKPGKKPATRGGKTRVAGHAGGGSPHHPSSAPPTGHPHRAGEPPHDVRPTGSSYESALGSNDEQVTIGAKGGPDLTDPELSGPMSDGAFLGECGAPDSMGVTVKVAIRSGRAVGVSVDTNPPAPQVATCIERHVRGLSWPANPKMDSVVTTY